MLTLEKLASFLREYSFSIKEQFVYKHECRYVLVEHPKTAIKFLMALSTKYRFPMSTAYNTTTFDIIKVASKQVTGEVCKEYPALQITSDGSLHPGVPVNEQLNDNYKEPILLPDFTDDVVDVVERQQHQLTRFNFCFKNLPYKLCLRTSNVISVTNKYNDIDSYVVAKYPNDNTRKWIFSTDIDTVYKKGDMITDTLFSLEIKFLSILDSNQLHHLSYLKDLDKFMEYSKRTYNKKLELQQGRVEVQHILKRILDKEMLLTKKKTDLSKRPMGNMQQDAARSRQIYEVENQIASLVGVQSDVLAKIEASDDKLKKMYIVMDELGFQMAKVINEFKREVDGI